MGEWSCCESRWYVVKVSLFWFTFTFLSYYFWMAFIDNYNNNQWCESNYEEVGSWSSFCVAMNGFFRAFLGGIQVRSWGWRIFFLAFSWKWQSFDCLNLLKMVSSFDVLIDFSLYLFLIFFNACRMVNKRVNDLYVIGLDLFLLVLILLWCSRPSQLDWLVHLLPLCEHSRLSLDVD